MYTCTLAFLLKQITHAQIHGVSFQVFCRKLSSFLKLEIQVYGYLTCWNMIFFANVITYVFKVLQIF